MACSGTCTLCGTLRAKCRCLDRPRVNRSQCHEVFDIAALYLQENRFFGTDAAITARKLLASAKQSATARYFRGELPGFNVLSRIERDAEHLEGRIAAKLYGTAQKMKEREAQGKNTVHAQADDGLKLLARLFPRPNASGLAS